MIKTHSHKMIFAQDNTPQNKTEESLITVCISLYNYESQIVETLQSVSEQTQAIIDLVVVEDCSTDASLPVAVRWLQAHSIRFNQIRLLQHTENKGLSAARNTAIAASTTPYVFILDADNLLYPRCITRCVEALDADSQASVAYPIIEKFGEEQALISNVVWNPERFKRENCVDAMSLIRKDALVAVGGYSELKAVGKLGWEDYDLWCKFIDQDFYGVPVPEILARYRTHSTSMLNSISNRKENIARLQQEMMQLHPWLDLSVT